MSDTDIEFFAGNSHELDFTIEPPAGINIDHATATFICGAFTVVDEVAVNQVTFSIAAETTAAASKGNYPWRLHLRLVNLAEYTVGVGLLRLL